MRTHRQCITLAVLGLLGFVTLPLYGAETTYHFLKEIPVGGEGTWDYMSVDSGARRLCVSHDTQVEVIDLEEDSTPESITNTPGVRGSVIAPRLGRGFFSNSRENKVSIVELKTLQTLLKVGTGEVPNAILYEPIQEEVYVFNERGRSATVFEARTGKVVTTLRLNAKPECAVADPQARRVYCNLEDKSLVAVIETRAHQVVNNWPTEPGKGPIGMAMDVKRHRLFLGCGNKLLVMMDSRTGKMLASLPIGERVDAVAFDPDTGLVFSSSGQGTVTVAREEPHGVLRAMQTLQTDPAARTMALDPKTHKIYVATAKFQPPPAKGAEALRQPPRPVPGTFKVLVYGP